MFSVVATIFG